MPTPSGTICIDEGTYTNTTAINLTLTQSDSDQMSFSDDNSTFSAWIAFSTSHSYTLPSGDGSKTVYARFRDSAVPATVSAVVSDSITLDTTAPTGTTISINGGAAVTHSQSVTLTLAATDAGSPNGIQMRFNNEGGSWSAWQGYASSACWTLSTGQGTKTVNVEFRDAAGNVAAAVSDTIDYLTPQVETAGKWLILKTPDYDTSTAGLQTSYLRLGAADSANEIALLESNDANGKKLGNRNVASKNGATFPGSFEYTDGDRTVVTRGTKREIVEGPYQLYLNTGTFEVRDADPIYGIEFFETGIYAGGKKVYRKREWGHVASDTYFFGDTESFFGGYQFSATFGLTNDIFVGGKLDISLAIALEASFGYKLALNMGLNFEHTEGGDIKVGKSHEIKAREDIHLRIKADHAGNDLRKSLVTKAIGFAAAGTVTAALITPFSAASEPDDAPGRAAGWSLGVAAAVYIAGMAASLVCALSEKAQPKISASELKMEAADVRMAVNNAAGQPTSRIWMEPSDIQLETNSVLGVEESFLWMKSGGDVTLSSTGKLQHQTKDGAGLFIMKPGGEMRMTMAQLFVKGQQVDINGVFQVV